MPNDPPPPRPSAASMVATLYFWALTVPTMVFGFSLFVFFWLATTPFDPQRRWAHTFVNTWMHLYLKIWPGWAVRVRGRDRIPKGPCVIVANHQSVADVLACMGLAHQFKFVSKGSLFSVPIVGWSMRMMRYVRVERGRPRSMQHMMEDCRVWLRHGMSVLIFPEGTYASARELLPFKRGAFKLAIEEQVPIVPVAVRGTSALVMGDGPWMSSRADIDIEVLEPIVPSAFGADEKLLADRIRVLLGHAVGREDPV